MGGACERIGLAGRDQVRAVLVHHDAGAAFRYSNPGAHLLSAILVRATGESVLDFARATLLDPVGIPSRPAFEEDGLPGLPGYEEFTRAAWVRQSTETQVDANQPGDADGYGYVWWVTGVDGDPTYAAVGSGGQIIEVIPNRNLRHGAGSSIRWNVATMPSGSAWALMKGAAWISTQW